MSPLPPTTCPAFLERGQRSIKHAAAALCLMGLFHYTLFTLLKVIARKEHAAHARFSSPLAKTAQGEHPPPPPSFRSRFLLICYLSGARIRLFPFRAPAPVLSLYYRVMLCGGLGVNDHTQAVAFASLGLHKRYPLTAGDGKISAGRQVDGLGRGGGGGEEGVRE